MLKQSWGMLKLFLLLMLILSGIYPLVLTGLANLLFPFQAQGRLIYQNNKIIGSLALGQNFQKPEYFHGRPSLTAYQTDEFPAQELWLWPNLKKSPLDLSEMDFPSASMLDPHISWQSMAQQTARVAQARGVTVDQLYQFVQHHGLRHGLVNVLELNLALDQAWKVDGKKT